MNTLRNVDLLRQLRNTIRNVPVVDVKITVRNSINDNVPGCLLAMCYKAGIVALDQATAIQWPTEFSAYFGCTKEEAEIVIFGRNGMEDEGHYKTGAEYAEAITELLHRYGHV